MGGSLGFSKSDASNQNQFSQNVWQPSGDAMQNLYGQASDLFNQQSAGGFGVNNPQLSQGINDQMAGGAYKDMGLQNSLMNSLYQSQNSPSAMQDINSMIMGGQGNNYADAMKNSYTEDANRAQQLMLGNLDARAAASGMSGGSRQGTATALGMQDINRNLQQNLATTGFNAFDKDLDRKLAIAGQADANTFGRQQLMSGMLGQQQGAMQSGLQSGMGYQNWQNMQPWQQAGAYSNILGGPTVLGSGSGGGSSSGKGASGSGFLGVGK